MTVANPLLRAVDSRVLNGRIITAIIDAKKSVVMVFKVIFICFMLLNSEKKNLNISVI